MASTAAGEGTSYAGCDGGGAGGKFRKRPYKRPQTTPYERPPPALPNPRNSGWLPKLVDPASKLIFASARMFFSSVFRKRLAPPSPPPLPPEVNQESRDRLQEAVPNLSVKNPPGVQGPATDDGGNPTNSFDGSEISNLERILKQKTFTRSEIDRLTELLQSKTVDVPNRDVDKRNESIGPQPVSAFGIQHEFASSLLQDDGIETHVENHGFRERIPTPVVSSPVMAEDVASPAELAKAYMSSTSKVSPSMLSLRDQTLREDENLLDNVPFAPKSPVMSLVSKPTGFGVPKNGFMNPRSRGRSAIYNMARAPYSRVNPIATQKGLGSACDGYGGPTTSSSSASKYAWQHDGQHGSKQLALKRRSSVLEDDVESVTPLRRLRQKTSLSTPKNLSLPVFGSPLTSRGTGVGSDSAQPSPSLMQRPICFDEPKHRTSKTVVENGDNGNPSTSYTPGPSKSSVMATRILQQLEMLVPKDKSSEGKVVTTREKSPSKLMPSMLRGQALRSLENVDSSKILQNAQDSHKLEDLNNTCVPDARDTTSKKQDKLEENGPKKLVVSRDALTPAVLSNATVSVKSTVPDAKTDSSINQHLTQPPQKKWAFHMSAHEEFLELDDDINSPEPTSTPWAEGKEKLETSMVDSKAASTEAVLVDKTSTLSEIKPPDGPTTKRSTDFKISDAYVADGRNTSFTFPTAPSSSVPFQPVVTGLLSTSTVDKILPPKELERASPLFSSSFENVDKIPVLGFSSSSSVSESLGLKSFAPSESKLPSSNSLNNIADGVPKIIQSDQGDNRNSHMSGELVDKSETSSSAAAPTSISTGSIFSFAAPANNSTLTNGALASSPFVLSSPAPVVPSSDFTNQIFTNSFTNISSSTSAAITSNATTITSASNSSLSTSSAAPSSQAAPIFKFGSTSAPLSSSVSAVPIPSTAETTDLKAKTDNGTTFGNLSSLAFGGRTFEMTSTGSSIFGFSASATSSSANNLSQGSLLGTSSGSLVSTQESPAGTSIANVTHSMPIQFGPSSSGTTSVTSSSPLFGSSSSSSSLFGSSTSSSSLVGFSTSSKLFDSSPTFGLSSSASSSQTNFISSSGATTPNLFGSTWQHPAFTSTSPSTGFIFAASSGSLPSTNSTPAFGSSTSPLSGSIFSFTSATAAASQPQPGFGSSINSDHMSMEDSMAEDPVQAATPAIPVFGQPPISTPPSGFVFGSTVPLAGPTFQFGGQQNQNTLQMPSAFQQSGSLEFSAGGSFSLGSGGGDKSARKIVKVKHKNRRR